MAEDTIAFCTIEKIKLDQTQIFNSLRFTTHPSFSLQNKIENPPNQFFFSIAVVIVADVVVVDGCGGGGGGVIVVAVIIDLLSLELSDWSYFPQNNAEVFFCLKSNLSPRS